MAVTYEWVLEILDDDDIIDTHHADTYAEACSRAPVDGTPWQIALVRDVHSNLDEDLQDRAWAYVEDGVLPTEFDNGKPVPARFKINR